MIPSRKDEYRHRKTKRAPSNNWFDYDHFPKPSRDQRTGIYCLVIPYFTGRAPWDWVSNGAGIVTLPKNVFDCDFAGLSIQGHSMRAWGTLRKVNNGGYVFMKGVNERVSILFLMLALLLGANPRKYIRRAKEKQPAQASCRWNRHCSNLVWKRYDTYPQRI